MSYFGRRAVQSNCNAGSSLEPHTEYEAFVRIAREYKGRATAARSRLARMRAAVLLRKEAERQNLYWDSRE